MVGVLEDMKPSRDKSAKASFAEGKSYRVAFPWVNEEGKLKVETVSFYRRFDAEGVPEEKRIRASFRVPEGLPQDFLMKVEMVCGGVKVRYATPVLIYTSGIKEDGTIVEGAIGGWEVRLWVFADEALSQLKRINVDYPVAKIDLDLVCKDKYGNVNLAARKGCLWKDPKLGEKYDKKDIKGAVDSLLGGIKDVVAPLLSQYQIASALKLEDAYDEGVAQKSNVPDEDDIMF